MKKSLVFNLLLAFVLIHSGCSQKQINSDVTNSADLLSQMPDPPAGYRAAPLWDWNDVITKKDIEFQMKKFKEGGIGGVFIHPRPGLVTEYLSEDWNQLFDYTVEMAKELGMQVWIYDENSYPSGFAGGHVQARYPDSYKHGTGLGYKITNTLADTAGLEIEVILQKTASGFKTIFSSTSSTFSTISTLSSDSTLYIFYRTHPSTSFWYGGFPYVDLLYPGVTDTFMKATMEGYEKYNKEDFGKTLRGVFTDEPNLSAAEGKGTVVRWTPDLFEQFEKRWGYPLQPNLGALVEETGEWMKVRHDYFTLTLEMFLDRWAVPWFNYCEKNNLDWTGHYWEHGWPYPGEGIDEAAFYMYHQMPGVDMLGRTYDPEGLEGQFGNIRAVRELGSSANQAGWRRTLSETWGGAGWQISFAELKRLVDWEVVMGVNFVNPHLSYYSMQGVRKFDYPPSFNYQEPWWDNFSLLGDYIGRICLAVSAGEQINNILVLQPNTTAWMYHSSTKDHPAIAGLSRTFITFVRNLEAYQYEYDLGSEQVMKRFAEVTHNGLMVRNRTYDHIVIPPGMRNIESTTLSMLEQYLDAGMAILCLSDSIDYIDGKPDTSLKTLAKKYPVTWIDASNLNSDSAISFFSNPDFVLKQTDTTKGQIFHQRRILEDGQLLFVVNSDLESPASAEVTIGGRNAVEIDLLTGKPLPLSLTKLPAKIGFTSEIPAGGSRLFLVTGKKITTDAPTLAKAGTSKPLSPVGDLSAKRLSTNVLTIDYLDLETATQKLNDTYFMTAMYALFKESGLETGNPWQHKIQYKKKYLELDNFGNDTWFKVKYRFNVDANLDPLQISMMEAVIERPDIWKVFLNGQEITPMAGRWWLDTHFPVFQIGSLVKTGENIIELRAPKMSVFAEIMPVYILGDFTVLPVSKGFTISAATNPGLNSWKTAGLPFYSSAVSYSREYVVDKPAGSYKLSLGSWKGSVAEVWVNGEKAGTIGWDPYELDITSSIRPDKNTVEVRVKGSLKNTLGFHHRVFSGWIFGPFSWNDSPDHQPAGEAYQFMDNGMFGDFTISNQR